jgi:hypothetical protein
MLKFLIILFKYCEVVYLERTPEISTSKIKHDLGYQNED